MKMGKLLGACLAFACIGVLTCGNSNVFADESGTLKKNDQVAIEKKLDASLGMPMLDGKLWKEMTPDSKVAFIWGFGHVVTIENTLMEKYPELKRDSFVAKTAEGMVGMPMKEVVEKIDAFYKENPQKIEDPVTKIIWDTMIKPNIKTGIAGRPLQK